MKFFQVLDRKNKFIRNIIEISSTQTKVTSKNIYIMKNGRVVVGRPYGIIKHGKMCVTMQNNNKISIIT